MGKQAFYIDFSADNSVRMAMAEPGRRPPPSQLYHCYSLAELDDAIGGYLAENGNPELIGAGLSVCGWERNGAFEMPNHSYSIERDWIRGRLDISRVHLINDCVASALAIERLEDSERLTIHAGHDDPTQMKAMIALGRALGTTCIVTDELGNTMCVPCAGGHCDLAATTDREYAVVRLMAQKFGHVSSVRAVSTAGLAEIFNNLNIIDGRDGKAATGADVVALARATDARAVEALAMAVGWLAATASDTALSVGARGGVFLAGSYFDVLGDMFDAELFRARFCAKGRLRGYLEDIAVYLVKGARARNGRPEHPCSDRLFRQDAPQSVRISL
ncbi:MAG: glucokinase [Asticcacaulis sp.]